MQIKFIKCRTLIYIGNQNYKINTEGSPIFINLNSIQIAHVEFIKGITDTVWRINYTDGTTGIYSGPELDSYFEG
jgi:hypothetical protein